MPGPCAIPGTWCWCPIPAIPFSSWGPLLCDAAVWEYPLRPENGFLPRLDEIPEDIARRAKFMVVSYPANPICRVAPDSFYRELIGFARKYQIMIVHDNAYSDIVFGGRQGGSFLAYEGAKEVGIEFYCPVKILQLYGSQNVLRGRKPGDYQQI